jgi:hypothetical protein
MFIVGGARARREAARNTSMASGDGVPNIFNLTMPSAGKLLILKTLCGSLAAQRETRSGPE